VAVAGARWSSASGCVRLTSAVAVALLGGKGLSATRPEDIGAEFLELRWEGDDVLKRAIVASAGPRGNEAGWCDVYVCACGREGGAALSGARSVLADVVAAIAARFGSWRECQPRALCGACLLNGVCGGPYGSPMAALPLSAPCDEKSAVCPWCRKAAAFGAVLDGRTVRAAAAGASMRD
jgi:hypothetical protein